MEKIDPRTVPQIRLSNGEEIPCIGMGTFGSDRFTPEQVSNAVAGAIRAGYRLFDCASVYGNEDLIGKVFEDAINSGEVKTATGRSSVSRKSTCRLRNSSLPTRSTKGSE